MRHHRISSASGKPRLASARSQSNALPVSVRYGTRCRCVTLLALLLAIAALTPATQALPPVNDTSLAAETIPPNGPFPYSTAIANITDATVINDPPLPECDPGSMTRSVWYSFTPATAGFYSISSCSDAPTATTVADSVMAIYTSTGGPVGPFTQIPTSSASVGCADDTCGPGFRQAAITTQLQADTTYYIVVWQYGTAPPTAGNASVQLRVSRTTSPGNDTCSSAKPVYLNVPVVGKTIGAANDYELAPTVAFDGIAQVPTTASGRDVVYTFTAPAAGAYSFKVLNYSRDNDLVVYVASSCPLGPAPVQISQCLGVANRAFYSSSEEVLAVPLAANQTVFVFVDEDGQTPGSSFTLEVCQSTQESEPNDTPATANPGVCGIEGAISPGGDKDYFALGSFPAGSRVFAMVDGSAANKTDLDLRITTATDTLQYDDESNDEAFGSFSPNVAGTPVPAEPIFAQVTFNDPQDRLVAEPYRLYAVVQPPISTATVETEPNNTRAQANSAANNYFKGTLANAADMDMFSFTAEAGTLLFISLDCDPLRDRTPANARLELLDENGNVLVTVDDAGFMSITNKPGSSLSAPSPTSPSEAIVHRLMNDGTYYVRVSLSPSVTGNSVNWDYLLSISKNCFTGNNGWNTSPRLVNFGVTSPVFEGQSVIVNGTIVDPDTADPHTVVIDWGDGSAPTTTRLVVGANNFALPHIYPNDRVVPFPISVTMSDSYGASVTTNANVTINNASPTNINLSLVAAVINEHDTATLNGSFTDTGVLDSHTVTIHWADDSLDTILNLPAGVFAFTANHQFLDDAPSGTPFDVYSITVTVQDNDGGSGSASTPLSVVNLAPTLSNVEVTSPIQPNSTATLTGNFADASPLDTFVLTINWGDGSVVQNVNLAAGASSFSVPHLYTLANTNLQVNLTLSDDDGGSASLNRGVVIKPGGQSARFTSVTQLPGGNILLQLQGSPGANYRIETSSNLATWSPFTTRTADATGFFQVEDGTASPHLFYRALLQ